MSAFTFFVRVPTEVGLEQRMRGPEGSTIQPLLTSRQSPRPPALLRVVRFGLRWLARALYLTPLLLLAKLLASAASVPEADLLVVPFVGLVVAFFALLVVYLFGTAIWWFGTGGRARPELEPPFRRDGSPRDDADDRESLPGPFGAGDGARVRVRGRVERVVPSQPDVLVRDLWAGGARGFRATSVTPFAVVIEDQPHLRVVVRCQRRSPIVVTTPREVSAEGFFAELSDHARATFTELGATPRDVRGRALDGSLAEVRVGDVVDVMAVVERRFDNLQALDLGLSVPEPARGYREAAPTAGVLLADLGDHTIRVRVLGRM